MLSSGISALRACPDRRCQSNPHPPTSYTPRPPSRNAGPGGAGLAAASRVGLPHFLSFLFCHPSPAHHQCFSELWGVETRTSHLWLRETRRFLTNQTPGTCGRGVSLKGSRRTSVTSISFSATSQAASMMLLLKLIYTQIHCWLPGLKTFRVGTDSGYNSNEPNGFKFIDLTTKLLACKLPNQNKKKIELREQH